MCHDQSMKLTSSMLMALTALAPACSRAERDEPAVKESGGTQTRGDQPSTAKAKESFGELTVDEVAERIGKPGVHIFDNNHREEWVKGHVPTATWVDYKTVSVKDLPADKNATLVFYCHNEH